MRPNRRTDMRRLLALTLALFTAAAHAQCVGQNLINALPPDQLAALHTAANVPFARGNLWQATKGAQTITVIGTYHLDDPRHAATLAAVAPAFTPATTLLVEAGPVEEAALKAHIASHPERLFIQSGPTQPQALSPTDWTRLSDALRARGIPPALATKMQAWYLTSLLAIPVCQFAGASAAQGLDRRLIDLATTHGLPIRALEPYDTIFTIFDSFTAADQVTMLIQTLDTEGTDDMAVTLSDSYFAGENRLYWEFSKLQLLTLSGATQEQADREFALVETAMITRRNQAWIKVITATPGPLIVAVGALHLPGRDGVLNLLQQNGYTIISLP